MCYINPRLTYLLILTYISENRWRNLIWRCVWSRHATWPWPWAQGKVKVRVKT